MSLTSAVAKHGLDFTFRHFTSKGTYSPTTGTVSGSTYTDYTVKAYPYDSNQDEVSGTEVVKGVRTLMLSSDGIPKPSVDDRFSGQGDTVSVTMVSDLVKGGATIGYILQVKE